MQVVPHLLLLALMPPEPLADAPLECLPLAVLCVITDGLTPRWTFGTAALQPSPWQLPQPCPCSCAPPHGRTVPGVRLAWHTCRLNCVSGPSCSYPIGLIPLGARLGIVRSSEVLDLRERPAFGSPAFPGTAATPPRAGAALTPKVKALHAG